MDRSSLNFWLVDSELPGPSKRSQPLIGSLPSMHQGSKPWDQNALSVFPDDYSEVAADPIAAKFLRPYRQSKEMLHSIDRWCLWMTEAQSSELLESPVIKKRLEIVRDTRLSSPTKAANEGATSPWLFLQRRQPTMRYLAVPEVSSEN